MIFNKAIKYTKNLNAKIYIDIGTNEGNEVARNYYLKNAKEAAEILKTNNPQSDFRFVIEEGGVHNEVTWAIRLDKMVNWFLDKKE